MLYGLAATAAALFLAALLTEGLRALAVRTGVLDRPGAHKGHTRPTPHFGGVAVVTATLTVAAIGPWDVPVPLLAAGGAVALTGLVDDLRPLGARPRLAVETGAAAVVAYDTGLTLLTGVLAVGWIVFVTNAFNLLDNSDGAMGAVGAVTALGLAPCAVAADRPGLAVVLCLLAAALGGFLVHNWHPARIFLGDCGSLFTGFVLASAAVAVHAGSTPAQAAGGLLTLTLVVTADTALVVASRRRAGRPLLLGGTDHIAHRLRRLGLTVQGAAVVLGLAAAAGTGAGILIHRGVLPPSAALVFVAGALLAVVRLLKVRVYGTTRAPARTRTPAIETAQVRA
ncbi:MraY family glycosyltransferase [Streptomyces beijiangensis]|uniref:Undecaprenyl/decaprenyl-phosphate alpha-N-acetylglucosaminyl 1-phosphate transferase n=1 Tax=Streptomyces beijiangensis TaxID=163361 RepID=A0A939JD82_9ACTN|nr:MraY family glycosyltransferase [Streptomyces beijiangensis]MBO0511756.1 undecaprenyl/decaprenyl-phosphate alpha-N-acetylglucosaminyl 1-phosphate transferase [Streptomyces beijiangensis]